VNVGSAFAIGISDVRFFNPPPSRPTRPQRKTGEGGIVRNLLRGISRELAHMADGSVTTSLPRITNYPY